MCGKSNTRKKLVSNKRNESRKVMHRKKSLKVCSATILCDITICRRGRTGNAAVLKIAGRKRPVGSNPTVCV